MTSEPGAGQPADVENTCKQCARYIGPTVVCPFCGHKNVRTSRITITKNAALVFAVVGLLALNIWAINFGAPAMNIADLTETANYATVTISGVIPRAPVYYPGPDGEPGTIYFTVDDGTQQVSVRGYPNPVVEDMLATGKIPAFGDRVNVTGNVYWYNAERGFILNNLEGLDIFRSRPLSMSIDEINKLDHEDMNGYYRVRTYGTVNSWRKFDFALDVTLIDEMDNEISVYIPASIYDLTGLGVLGKLEVGMGLEVAGCLEYYDAGSYSKWEIIPATTAELVEVRPDLKITDVETSPLVFPLSQQFTVNVTVGNVGHLPVQTATVTIKLDNATAFTTTVLGLGAGESVTVTYNGAITDQRDSMEVSASVSLPAPHEDENPADNNMTEGYP